MFALLLVSIFLLPAGVGVSLAFIPVLRRRHVAVLRALLTLSLLPWFSFLLELSRSASVSLAEHPSFTPALFLRAAAPSVFLALILWMLALLCARRFPTWVTGLPLAASILATSGTLRSIRGATLVFTPAGEPDSGFYFNGLYGFWLFIYSSAAWLALTMFVGFAHRRGAGG